MNDDSKISINEIEKIIKGPSLSQDLIHSFESAFVKFKKEFDPNSDESKERLNEIVRLLTVSEENLEQIKDQKWFQRIWKTITGKNRKLEKINKINLFKVQKGAIYFLQKLAEQNQLMSQSVYFALQRIEDIQIQNEQIKGYLFRILNKYNERIRNIESRLQQHEEQLSRLSKRDKVSGIFWLLIGITLLTGTAIYFHFFKGNLLILSAGLGVSILAFLASFNSFSRKDRYGTNQNYIKTGINDKLRIKNEKVKPELKQNLTEFIYNSFILNERLYSPINPFLERYESLENILSPFNENEGMASEEVATIIWQSLQISADCSSEIKISCFNITEDYVNFVNALIDKIISKYLPDSVGIDLQTHLGYDFQKRLNQRILSVIEPYFENMKELESLRKKLLSDYPKYRKILTRNPWIDFARWGVEGFLGGFLLGPIGWAGSVIWEWLRGENEREIIETFAHEFEVYINSWENTRNSLINSVIPFLENIFYSLCKDTVENMDMLFDEFSNNGKKLKSLNREIKKYLKKLQNKFRQGSN